MNQVYVLGQSRLPKYDLPIMLRVYEDYIQCREEADRLNSVVATRRQFNYYVIALDFFPAGVSQVLTPETPASSSQEPGPVSRDHPPLRLQDPCKDDPVTLRRIVNILA